MSAEWRCTRADPSSTLRCDPLKLAPTTLCGSGKKVGELPCSWGFCGVNDYPECWNGKQGYRQLKMRAWHPEFDGWMGLATISIWLRRSSSLFLLPTMRLSQLFTLGLAATALAHPVADVEADVSELQPVHTLEKRASYFYSCQVVASALKYRTCPSTSCTAVGQYPNGKILKTTKTSLDHIPYVEPLIERMIPFPG